MKNYSILLIFIALTTSVNAQLDSALRYRRIATPFNVAVQNAQQRLQTTNPTDTGEGGEYAAFSRWAERMGNHVANDAPADSDMYLPAAMGAIKLMTNPNFYCSGSVPAVWSCLGPFNDYYGTGTEYSGRVDNVWCDPNNDSFLLATSLSGGVWQTNNQGHSWHCISDGAPVGPNGVQLPGTVSVRVMAVDPLNRNNIFLQTATPDFGDKSWGYGTGMVFTTNGGASWQADTSFNRLRDYRFSGGRWTWGMKYMPNTHKLFAFNDSQLYVKDGVGGGIWTRITPTGLPRWFTFTEMDFSRRYPGKVILSGRSDSIGRNAAGTEDSTYTAVRIHTLWIYDTSTNAFTTLALTMPSSGDTLLNIIDISITNMDTAYLLVNGHNTAAFRKLIKTSIYANAVSVRNGTMGVYFDIVVSPSDPRNIYVRNYNGGQSFFERSIDEGANYSSIQNTCHIDVRFLSIYKDTGATGKYNDVLLGGTDGGVVMKRRNDSVFRSITGDSLCISQFYGMSNTEANEDYMVGGLQDNGGFSYIKGRGTPWQREFGGDGFLVKMGRNNENIAYTNGNPPEIYKLQYSNITTSQPGTSYPNELPAGGMYNRANNIQRPLYFDQNDTAYVGYSQVWKKPLTDVSWHPAFTTVSKSVAPGIKIGDIEMYENGNNDTFYVAYRDAGDNQKLFRSRNASDNTFGRPTWSNITPAEAINFRINDITIDQEHPWRIWVAFGDFSYGLIYTLPDSMKHHVLFSPDFGNTWIDVSSGLGNFPANKILFRKGTEELYLGTDIGVYRADFSTFNPASNVLDTATGQYTNRSVHWKCFNDGMPICEISDLEFNYCAGKLRAATMGRGVWETPLPAITHPSDTQMLVIHSNTTWTDNKWLESSVFIPSGVTLTIKKDTIHMPRYGVIAVAPGGHLVVDTALL
ncbi:MAG: hypothetical protein EBZ77_00080, partial [Chitinophagia bacterium]|nr:hypothetical protein [Chitinophagia bacterium]